MSGARVSVPSRSCLAAPRHRRPERAGKIKRTFVLFSLTLSSLTPVVAAAEEAKLTIALFGSLLPEEEAQIKARFGLRVLGWKQVFKGGYE